MSKLTETAEDVIELCSLFKITSEDRSKDCCTPEMTARFTKKCAQSAGQDVGWFHSTGKKK